MEFNTVLQRRYSCRAFSPTPVEHLSDPDTLQAVKGVTRSNYGAPLILVVGCRPADAWVRRYDGKNGAEVDAAIVSTYLMLAAENEGLSTLWVGSFDQRGELRHTDSKDGVAHDNGV